MLHRSVERIMYHWLIAMCVSACLWQGTGLAQQIAPARSGKLSVGAEGTSVLLRDGDRLLAEYRYADVIYKPYIKQLFTPGGINVLLDSPYDHKHHRGLMFAVAAQGSGFWIEERSEGRELHRSFKTSTADAAGTSGVAMIEALEWVNPAGDVLVREERSVAAHAAEGIDATLLTWRTKLASADADKPLTLRGDHYYGLGMRFVRAMDRGGKFLYPEGTAKGVLVRGDEYVTPADWCAYTARTEGKEVTVALFSSPANPRHPTHWFTMTQPFAFMGATLNLWKQPMTLDKGATLNLCYGVAAWDGAATAEQIGRMYQRWLETAKP